MAHLATFEKRKLFKTRRQFLSKMNYFDCLKNIVTDGGSLQQKNTLKGK
jgi:hypothetical protein